MHWRSPLIAAPLRNQGVGGSSPPSSILEETLLSGVQSTPTTSIFRLAQPEVVGAGAAVAEVRDECARGRRLRRVGQGTGSPSSLEKDRGEQSTPL